MKSIAIKLIALLFLVGCESGDGSAYSDPDLLGAKEEAVAYINQSFGTHGTGDGIEVTWGDLSQCWSNGIIEINKGLVGQPDAIQSHMRHEVFHAITGMADGSAREYNGVEIASKIAWVNK